MTAISATIARSARKSPLRLCENAGSAKLHRHNDASRLLYEVSSLAQNVHYRNQIQTICDVVVEQPRR